MGETCDEDGLINDSTPYGNHDGLVTRVTASSSQIPFASAASAACSVPVLLLRVVQGKKVWKCLAHKAIMYYT